MDHLKVNRKKKKEREVSRHHKEIDYLVLALKKRERHTHILRYIKANKKCVNCSFSMWHANLKTRKALNNKPDPKKLGIFFMRC